MWSDYIISKSQPVSRTHQSTSGWDKKSSKFILTCQAFDLYLSSVAPISYFLLVRINPSTTCTSNYSRLVTLLSFFWINS